MTWSGAHDKGGAMAAEYRDLLAAPQPLDARIRDAHPPIPAPGRQKTLFARNRCCYPYNL